MANKGKRGTLSARDWACALRRCARCVCVYEPVLVFVFVCLCSVWFLVLVAFGLMSSVMGHPLDWLSNGPVSRPLRSKWTDRGHVIARVLSPNSKIESKRFENKFGAEWAWNRSPAGGPGYPHEADA